MIERLFTLAEARAVLPEVLDRAGTIVRLRAELSDAQMALQVGATPPGGIPEYKALEAHLQEAIDWFGEQGIQLKGIAPLIVDFPSEVGGEPVLLCWLEGEPTLAWYHVPEAGFMGRRPLPDVV